MLLYISLLDYVSLDPSNKKERYLELIDHLLILFV